MRSLAIALAAIAVVPVAFAEPTAPLVIEARIPLGDVRGRIDHLAIDLVRRRLYVAELGNDSVGVVDLTRREVLRRITGLAEPQGLGYVAATDTLYVANAQGSVRLYDGEGLSPAGRIDLGDDADNVRVDSVASRVYVGYGGGALAVIDAATRRKTGDIPLEAHPEGFQLEPEGRRIFVNVPDSNEITVVDRSDGEQRRAWPTGSLRANFPLALDEDSRQVLVVFRHPAMLGVFDAKDGALLGSTESCGDSDDLFVDHRRARVYVSCGEGLIDTFERRDGAYVRIARLATAAGARTSLYVPELDRLFLAVRSTPASPAAIWVLSPRP